MNERNILEVLGKNMHDIRYEKNMSLLELAEKTNLDIDKLRKFEAGEYSGLDMRHHSIIADGLGVGMKNSTKTYNL